MNKIAANLIHLLGKNIMKLFALTALISLPFMSCGTVVAPESAATSISSPVASTNPDIADSNTKNYLEITDNNSYKTFVEKFSFIKPTSEDLKIAQHIIDLRKKDTLKEIKSLLPRVLPLITNNTNFSFYRSWLDELTILANKKLILEKLEYCQQRWEKESSTIFENHIEILCHQSMKDYIIAKSGHFPETWDIQKTWSFLKRRASFYFSSSENVAVVKKAVSNLSKKDQTILLTSLADVLLTQDIVPHSSMTQLISSSSPLGASTLLDLNARKQQRREISHELSTIYGTGGSEVEANYYDSVTNDLIQTTTASKLTLGEDFIAPRLIVFADFLTRNSRQDLSRKILDHVKANFKISSNDVVEYHFNYLWSYLTLQDYKSAVQYAEKASLLDSFNELDSKLQYWIAYSYQMQRELSKSLKFYSALVNTNPVTYYSIMAMKNIKLHNESAYQKIVQSNFGIKKELLEPLKEWSSIFKTNLVRLASWAKLGSYSMISQEYNFFLTDVDKHIANYNADQKILARSQILHGAAILFNSNSSYLSTFRFMGQAIQEQKIAVDFNFIQTLFPTPFNDLIKGNSYDVDHILLFGLMRQESGFDPRARSAAGATGLMQLMPYTARMVDRSIASNLTNPVNNASIGIRYLKKLLDKFDNNLVYSLAAYNAGDHRVNNWMKCYFKHESLLFNIESIPYAETRNYVKLIFRNMFFYKLVEEHDIKDSHAFNQLFNIQLGFNQ